MLSNIRLDFDDEKKQLRVKNKTKQASYSAGILPQAPFKKECSPVALLFKLRVQDHLTQKN